MKISSIAVLIGAIAWVFLSIREWFLIENNLLSALLASSIIFAVPITYVTFIHVLIERTNERESRLKQEKKSKKKIKKYINDCKTNYGE